VYGEKGAKARELDNRQKEAERVTDVAGGRNHERRSRAAVEKEKAEKDVLKQNDRTLGGSCAKKNWKGGGGLSRLASKTVWGWGNSRGRNKKHGRGKSSSGRGIPTEKHAHFRQIKKLKKSLRQMFDRGRRKKFRETVVKGKNRRRNTPEKPTSIQSL